MHAGCAGTRPDVPSDFSLIFSRGGCFGACPAYTVELFSDGKVIYNGNFNVRLKGEDSSSVLEVIVSQLFNDSQKIFLRI
jgi:hypothetical protein